MDQHSEEEQFLTDDHKRVFDDPDHPFDVKPDKELQNPRTSTPHKSRVIG